MTQRTLATTPHASQQLRQLRADFAVARQQLLQAEAQLAAEQAAVNAFRMHCRLRLDDVVDEVLRLYGRKQALLAAWQLRRETTAPDLSTDDAHPLESEYAEEASPESPETLVEQLPYHLPRDKASEKRLYRALVKRFHPDLADGALAQAYATSMMAAVNAAYEVGDTQTLYDLAGELTPDAMADLAHIESQEVRQVRRQLLQCQRRQRKVAWQLHTLHTEKTAQLWRKAQALEIENSAGNWWDEVRQELQQSATHLQREVDQLQQWLGQVSSADESSTL